MGTQEETVGNKSNGAIKVLYPILNGKSGSKPLPPNITSTNMKNNLFQQPMTQQPMTQQLGFIEKGMSIRRNMWRRKKESRGGEEDIRPEGVLGRWRQQLSPGSS